MWKSRKKLLKLILSVIMMAGLALVAYTPNASALSLNPGGSGFLSGATPPTGITILDETTSFIGTDFEGNEVFTGSLQVLIKQDSSDGTLDFYYKLVNDSSSDDAINRTTHSDFTNWNTEVEYETVTGSSDVGPSLANRDSDGSNVGFIFFADPLDPGESSLFYYINTDATSYNSGSTAIINAGTANVSTYGPSIPDPAAVFLLGSACLIGFSGLRRKFKK